MICVLLGPSFLPYIPQHNAQRVTNYRRYLNSIDLTGIKFPTPINQVGRFEKNNPTLSINVYVLGKNEKEIIPKYVTKCGKRQKHIDLLLLTSGDKSHYVWIKNMSALICHRSKSKSMRYSYVRIVSIHSLVKRRSITILTTARNTSIRQSGIPKNTRKRVF
jgi:hypothetical protein